MAVVFQEEMRQYARPAGEVPVLAPGGHTRISADSLASLNIQKNISYARYGERTLEMDVYRPKDAWGKLPAVVCIHGGGWAKGSRIHHASIAQGLAARGYVAATISYRLSGEAPFPAAVHDCKAAVRFLRANADAYGIDPDAIGATGSSAGGHLAALLASSPNAPEIEGDGGNPGVSSAIQAGMPMGAQTDFLSARNKEVSAQKDIWKQFMSGSQAQQPALYKQASPLAHLSKKSAPCWLISGEHDDPSTHAEAFRKKLDSLGIQNKLSILKDAPHGFANKQIWFDQMLEIADDFFSKTLKKNSK
jgi:acetyl esterase/lipase